MGPELIAPLLLSAGGAVLQQSAKQDAADQKRETLNRQLERTDQTQKKATALVLDEGQNYSMDNRLKQMQAAEDQTRGQIETDIQGAGGASVGEPSQDAGNVSEDFLKSKAARAITEGGRMTEIAREAAKTRAPGTLLSNDALRRAGMTSNLQNAWGTNTNMARATGNDADSVQEPGYGALGAIASAVAPATVGMMGKGAGVSWDPDGSFSRKYAMGMGR